MRIFLLVFVLLCGFEGQAKAFLEYNSPVYWRAYTLSDTDGAGTDTALGKCVLLALTVVPRPDTYLYGVASLEGLPTTVEVKAARLAAFPMKHLSAKEISTFVQEKGKALLVRAPVAPLKKDTPFAAMVLPGSEDSNPPIYPGPATFWVKLPSVESNLGGIAVQVVFSGLLCSASSCTPVASSLEIAFSSKEIAEFPPAAREDWWQDWQQGANVLIAPPEETWNTKAGIQDDSSSFPSFSRDRGSVPALRSIGGMESTEEAQNFLAQYSALFTSLKPNPFNPTLEVQTLGEALFFGLVAGLLLNLMPCVLPVISLKFSALMTVSAMTDKQAQTRAFRAHCIVFALGILTWFVVLAMLLGCAGWAWGELFQRPSVIAVLGLLLFLLGLSLFGVFSLPVLDLKVTNSRHPHFQAFASGLLATLLATPCSGPLLGGMLAWAIRQDLPVLVLAVASSGLGMALPYLIMATCPRLVHLLPRPGSWTLRLEQLLGFFLIGSSVYLAMLLPSEWIPAFLFMLFIVALAAWLWGQIGHLRASRFRRRMARGIAAVLVLVVAWWGSASIYADSGWEAFDPEEFGRLLGHEPMLLEFTADWCPSCKALEYTTLNRQRMATLRNRYNARTIRVDITRNAAVAKELLKALNSTSIPVLALFPKGEDSKKPTVLRDIVTPNQLEKAARQVF